MAALLLSTAYAQGFSITIMLDEEGNGLFTNTNGFIQTLPGVLATDPRPGGLAPALTYGLLTPPGIGRRRPYYAGTGHNLGTYFR